MITDEKVARSEGPEEEKTPRKDRGDTPSSRYGLIMYCGLEKEDSEER